MKTIRINTLFYNDICQLNISLQVVISLFTRILIKEFATSLRIPRVTKRRIMSR